MSSLKHQIMQDIQPTLCVLSFIRLCCELKISVYHIYVVQKILKLDIFYTEKLLDTDFWLFNNEQTS